MAFEREHKFTVVGAFPELTKLQEAYAALALELRPQETRDQRDVYYDTPALTLQRAGVALRLRRYDGQTFATYKGAGIVEGSLHSREELELPYTGSWPAEVLEKLEPLGVANALEPLLELVTKRQRFLLVEDKQTQAELTFDEVTSSCGERKVSFLELELEAAPDTPDSDLKTFALPLNQPGLEPHAEDKLTHALTLLGRL